MSDLLRVSTSIASVKPFVRSFKTFKLGLDGAGAREWKTFVVVNTGDLFSTSVERSRCPVWRWEPNQQNYTSLPLVRFSNPLTTGSWGTWLVFLPHPDLIFVTNITNYICGEKIAMWRIFSFPCMTIAGKSKISLHVEKFQMSSHDRCGKIWNSPHLACVWCRKRRHICKIYAIFLKNQFCQNLRTLSRNPFCCNLRTFVWRKIYPKILYVEKKWQISGLHPRLYQYIQ